MFGINSKIGALLVTVVITPLVWLSGLPGKAFAKVERIQPSSPEHIGNCHECDCSKISRKIGK